MGDPAAMFMVDLKISQRAINWSHACTSEPAWSLGGSIFALTEGVAALLCAGVVALPCTVSAWIRRTVILSCTVAVALSTVSSVV